MEEVEAFLTAHEMRMSKFDKLIKLDSASIDSIDSIDSTSSSHFPSYGSGFRGRGGRNGRGRGQGRFGNVQCQVCFKFGHLASMCYHRFDQQYQVPIPHDF